MKSYIFTDAAKTWWAQYRCDGMLNSDNQTVLQIRSQNVAGAISNTDLDDAMTALGLPNHVGYRFTEVEFKALAVAINLNLTKAYQDTNDVATYTALTVVAAPSNIVLAVGSATPVGDVTNVAIPDAGGIDMTGAVIGWVDATANKVKITVTNAASTASTITVNGVAYTSGADLALADTTTLTVVITTTRAGYFTTVRTLVISVSA